jgi:hypothetical protein
MTDAPWHIYLGEIPHGREGNYWVSFESDPAMKVTKANIYGRCLPCIQNLYEHLQAGRQEIKLGTAFQCWKITAVVQDLDEAVTLLTEFEKRFPQGHVYGKIGNGRPGAKTTVVVFHGENEAERDRLKDQLTQCLEAGDVGLLPVQVSRGCAVLYHDILGDGKDWQPVTAIKNPENMAPLLQKIKDLLYRSAMS